MSTRDSLMQRIRTNLTFFEREILTASKKNQIDSSAVLEDFSLGLLNLIYGYDLVNANNIRDNYPAVDLIDVNHRIAVQVTTNNSLEKIWHTRDEFLLSELHLRFDMLIVLILGNTAARSRDIKVREFDLQIMTMKDLLVAITALDLDRLQKVDTYLQEHIGAADDDGSSAHASHSASIAEINRLTNSEKEVLIYASFLSDEGLERSVFEQGLSSRTQYKILHDLIDQHFLFEDNAILHIPPDIRKSCRRRLKRSRIDCTVFLDRLWDYEQSTRWDRIPLRRKIRAQKCLALLYENACDILSDPNAVYLCRSAELWQNLSEFEHACKAEQRALKILQSSKHSSWSIARAYHFTGNCNWEQAENFRSNGEKQEAFLKYQLALDDWETVLNMCRNQLTASDPDVAAVLQDVGQAQLALEHFFPARDTLLRALKLREQIHSEESDYPKLKKLYGKLDEVYRGLRNSKSAELCRRRADQPGKPIWELLNKELAKAKTYRFSLPLPTALTADHFVGRKKEMKAIKNQLQKGVKPIVISGLGGTGKTELAIHFGQQYTEGSVYFIRFQNSFTYTLASMFENIRPTPFIESSHLSLTERYQFVMSVLADCSETDLLIVDSVEYAPSEPWQLMRDLAYRDLEKLDIRLILTTRSPIPGNSAISLSSLQRNDLYQIFESHGAKLSQPQMDALIDFVSGHTLSIDLIARTLTHSFGLVTPEELLDALRSNTLDNLYCPEVETAYTKDQRTIIQHLQTMFNISDITEAERRALCCVVLFPDSGLNRKLTRSTLPKSQYGALGSLKQKGLITSEGNLISIHPVIRLVCCEAFRPSDETCRDFLDSLWEYYRQNYNDKTFDRMIFSQMAEVFTHASDLLEDQDAKWINCAGFLWNELKESQNTLKVYMKHLPSLEKRIPGTQALSNAYTILGIAYGRLGDHHREADYQLKALRIQSANPSADRLSFSATLRNIATAYSAQGKYTEALEYSLESLSLQQQILSADHPEIANSCSSIGMVYEKLLDFPKAMEYLMRALDIRKRILPEDHPDLATSYDQIGAIYGQIGNYEMSLEYTLKALEIREIVLTPDHPDLAASYSNVSRVFADIGDHSRALEYSLKSLYILRRILSVENPALANCYSNTGIIYTHLGDYSEALQCQLKALEIREHTLPDDHPEIVLSHNSIASIYMDLELYDKALTHLLEAYSINLRILQPDAPALADSCADLGMTYFCLGDYFHALHHLENAISILRNTLSDKHPKIQSIKATICRIKELMK